MFWQGLAPSALCKVGSETILGPGLLCFLKFRYLLRAQSVSSCGLAHFARTWGSSSHPLQFGNACSGLTGEEYGRWCGGKSISGQLHTLTLSGSAEPHHKILNVPPRRRCFLDWLPVLRCGCGMVSGFVFWCPILSAWIFGFCRLHQHQGRKPGQCLV